MAQVSELPWGKSLGDQFSQPSVLFAVGDKDHAPEVVEVGLILNLLTAPLLLLRDVLMLERGAVVQHPLHVLIVGEDMGAYGG